jgi:acyl-coenzyme A thioesterase PaaI-like protein
VVYEKVFLCQFTVCCTLLAGRNCAATGRDSLLRQVAIGADELLGWPHGGLIATLLDASMTVAARYTFDPDGSIDVATIDLTISFIGHAKETLLCDAKVTARRGSTVYAQAQAVNETGDLVASSVTTLRVIGKSTGCNVLSLADG